jgi:hypothetical protein
VGESVPDQDEITENGQMIRQHVRHLHREIDEKSIAIRAVITVGAILMLPLLGTAVRRFGQAFDLGMFTLPLLAVAHVPAVIAIIAVWSIGCDVCR